MEISGTLEPQGEARLAKEHRKWKTKGFNRRVQRERREGKKKRK
jgi:hypothetical protein